MKSEFDGIRIQSLCILLRQQQVFVTLLCFSFLDFV